MCLVKIEPEFAPCANPREARGTQCYGNAREFTNRLRNFLRKRAKIRVVHFRRRLAVKFPDGPLGLVGDFPRKKPRGLLKFTKHRNQTPLQKGLAPAAELQALF